MMDLKTLVLVIINRLDGERTIYSALHLLRGKRSGQTLQDVKYYNLNPFFGLLPKLEKEVFDVSIDKLRQSSLITIDKEAIVHITQAGKEMEVSLRSYHFNGWDYRGAEQLFFARLSLFVQTLSHFRVNEKSFMPTQRDREVQLFTKNLLMGQPIMSPEFSLQLKEELVWSMNFSTMSETQKQILTYRLGGYKQTGWTWSQLSQALKMDAESIRLNFIESLHLLLSTIENSDQTPFLTGLAKQIKVSSYLTDSARKTNQLFVDGKSIEEICEIRNLKRSTIEDHFVEISSNDERFPVAQFILQSQIEEVFNKVEELGTKRLRILKDEFPTLTYFQLRLILGVHSRGVEK